MPAVTANQFKAEMLLAGPHFQNLDDDGLQALLNRLERLYYPIDKWEDSQFDAIVQHCAHIVELEYMQAQRQAALASNAVKGEPVQLTGFSNEDSNLKLTHYGQEVLRLRDNLLTTLGIAFG